MMRAHQLGQPADVGLATAAGASPADLEDLFRLLAIAKYTERYVIPPAHREDAGQLQAQHEQLFSQCSLDTEGGPGMGGQGPPASVASFHPGGQAAGQTFRDGDGTVRFNLLGWDGSGAAPHLFPEGGPS
jgi:nitrate reductase beta subunit